MNMSCGRRRLDQVGEFDIFTSITPQALLRAKLGHVQLELNHWFLPTPSATHDELGLKRSFFYWAQLQGETAFNRLAFNGDAGKI